MQTGGHPVYMLAPNHVSYSLHTGQQQINKLKEHIGIKPIVDMTRPMSYMELQRQNEEYQVRCFFVAQSAFIREITAEIEEIFIDAIVNQPAGLSKSAIIATQFDGAIGAVNTTATAFAHRSVPLLWIELAGVADNESYADTAAEWTNALKRKVQPYSLGSYVNDIDLNKSANEAASYTSNLKRLRAVKYRYDPENVFHHNRNITPAAAL
jgi:hypothetical protein